MNIITTRAPNWPQVVWNGFQFDWFQLDRVIPHRGYVYSCTYTLLKISGQPVENLMIGLAMDEDGGHLSRYYVGRQVANQGVIAGHSCMLSTVSVAVIGLWAAPHHSHSLHSSSSPVGCCGSCCYLHCILKVRFMGEARCCNLLARQKGGGPRRWRREL